MGKGHAGVPAKSGDFFRLARTRYARRVLGRFLETLPSFTRSQNGARGRFALVRARQERTTNAICEFAAERSSLVVSQHVRRLKPCRPQSRQPCRDRTNKTHQDCSARKVAWGNRFQPVQQPLDKSRERERYR